MVDVERASRPTARGRRTQEAIDAAARKVIAQKGFLKMTVADIVAEAGKSPGSFYNYYDSKEALLEVWAREFQAEAQRRANEATSERRLSAREWVEVAARAHWDTYRERLAEMVGVFQLAMINDEFAAVWDGLCQEAARGIAGSVRSAQAKGWCPGMDADLVAQAIVSQLNMFCYEKLANGRAATVDDEASVATLAELWYRQIYWKA